MQNLIQFADFVTQLMCLLLFRHNLFLDILHPQCSSMDKNRSNLSFIVSVLLGGRGGDGMVCLERGGGVVQVVSLGDWFQCGEGWVVGCFSRGMLGELFRWEMFQVVM